MRGAKKAKAKTPQLSRVIKLTMCPELQALLFPVRMGDKATPSITPDEAIRRCVSVAFKILDRGLGKGKPQETDWKKIRKYQKAIARLRREGK